MEPACVCSPRENYLKKIRGFYHDDGMIKVITGVRRGGKSRLMQCIAEELRAEGVDDEHIVFFGLDRYGYRSVKTPGQLEALVGPLLAVSGTKYLFIDEVQNVGGFEDVLNGLRTEGGFSIFIIGSNSYLLSGELATKLTGRCIEFEMQTLGFGECCQMKRFLGLPVNPNPVAEFDAYILEGGFPKAMDYPRLADKRAYVAAVIQEIFEKDIRRRVNIKNVSVFNQVRDHVACEHPIGPREQAGREGQARDARAVPPDPRGREDRQQVRPLRPEVAEVAAGRAEVLPG